jgi:hypothetical protein
VIPSVAEAATLGWGRNRVAVKNRAEPYFGPLV